MNKNVKLLSMMLSLIMCLSAFTAIFSTGAVAAACTHENSKYYGYQEPTCLVPGGDMYRCEDCGEIYAKNVVPTTDHTPGPAATCTTNQICTVCKTEIKAALGHDWKKDKDGKVIVYTEKANCAAGADEYTYTLCSVCGHKEKSAPVAGSGKHVLVANESTIVAPTCAKPGSIVYECKNCDYTDTVEIRPLAHVAMKYVAEVPATCTKDGLKAHNYCADCQGYFTADKAEPTTKDALVLKAGHPENKVSQLQVKQAGSCNTDRILELYCSACDTKFDKNEGKIHTWAANGTPATCVKYGYSYNMCVLCGEIDANSTKRIDPLGHQIAEGDKGVYHKNDCENDAYTEYTCLRTNCDTNHVVKVIDEKNLALGHDLKKVADAKDPTCTALGSTAKFECQREGCGYTKGGDDVAMIDHKYADVKHAQTCMTDGYTRNECTACGKVYVDKNGKEAEPKDIVKADGVSHVVKTKNTVDPTCTTGGTEWTYCEECDKIDAYKDLAPLGHNYELQKDKTFAGTCTEKAYEIFICKTCKNENKVFGKLNLTPEGHEAAMGTALQPTVVKVLREGTCQVKELVRYECAACNGEYDKNTKYGSADHTLVQHSGVSADCTTETNGWKNDGIYCQQCTDAATAANKGVPTYVWNVEPTVIPFEHKDETKHDAKDATCFAPGYKAFSSCTVCDASGNAKAAHSFALLSTTTYKVDQLQHVGTDVVVKATAPTCTTKGNDAYRYCSVCKHYFEEALKDAKKSALDNSNLTAFGGRVEIAANGHSYTNVPKTFTATKTCDQYAYTYHECTVCGDNYVDEFVNTKEHTWNKGVVTAPTCTTKGFTDYTCGACGATAKNLKAGDDKAALGHINAKGEIFFGLCNETVEDRQCVRDLDGDKKADCSEKFDENNEIHTYTSEKVVSATCDAYGYTMKLCANCDEKMITKYEPATGHSKTGAMDDKKQVAPTYTTTGLKVWTCYHVDANTGKPCGADVTEVLPVLAGLNITIDADSAIKSGEAIVNGGLVQFTVKLETIDLMANSLLTTFTYNGMILEFVDAKVENIFGEGTINDYYANVVTEKTGNVVTAKNGTLIISSYAPNTAEGKVQDVKVTGSAAYAVITFRINKDAAGLNAELTATNLELLNIKGDKPVKAVTEDAPVVESMAISKLGETNNDAAINSVDALSIRKMITGELVIDKKVVQYSAMADVDMDGDVDLEDFARLNKYLIGAITYDQLVLNK